MSKVPGLKRRGDIYHIDKIVRVGTSRRAIRETTGCRTEREARVVLERRVYEVRAELLNPPPPVERTFAEAAIEYVANLERRGKSSARCMQDMRLVLPVIGELALSHVHQRTLQLWIDSQRGVRASGTVARALRTVSTILNFAASVLRDGNSPWLPLNPPRLIAPDWGERKPRSITWAEQDALIAALPEHLIAPVLFAVATGARQHEVVTLRWEQHRLQPDLPEYAAWWIPPEIRKSNARKSTSQQEGRFLICNDMTRTLIAAQGTQSEWLFPSPRGEHFSRINNHGWRTACSAAGLAIRFHDLRHTFGQRAADAGIPLDIRRSLLGHHHRDITLHYSSPGLVKLLEEVERIVRVGVSHKKGYSRLQG